MLPSSILVIEGLAPGGEGTGTLGEERHFVPYTAPGDEVELSENGGLLRVLRPSEDRVVVPCQHFGPSAADSGKGPCGGCDWLHVNYPAQLRAKAANFERLVERLKRANVVRADSVETSPRVLPIIGSPSPLHYRCRATFRWDENARRLAFTESGSHRLVPLSECWITSQGLENFRAAVTQVLTKAVKPVQQMLRGVRSLTLEWSEPDAGGALSIETTACQSGNEQRWGEALAAVGGLKGLVVRPTSDARDAGTRSLIWGDPLLRQWRDPANPEAGTALSRPDVFIQSNRGANSLLVKYAMATLVPENKRVLELCCGSGNFTQALEGHQPAQIWAIELEGAALDLARRQRRSASTRFFAGDALKVAIAFGAEGQTFDAVLLDPPRAGLRGMGRLLYQLKVKEAVYVSCDPATLIRDLTEAAANGYRTETLQPIDLFPQTRHLEVVARLVRDP